MRVVPFLREIRLETDSGEFPFSLPVFDGFQVLAFDTPVTLFVGENGSGKSTLLEIVAAGLRLPALTQQRIDTHPLMAVARDAAGGFRFVRDGGRRRGFFFRADDVTGFLQTMRRSAEEHKELAQDFAKSLPAGWGRDRAVGTARAQAHALAERYGEDPFAQSHGELFLALFRARLTGPGLYLLDEPEMPLSPTNQLALLAMIQDAAAAGAQFLIATHSPILMALPGATILDMDTSPPAPVEWEDVEHVALTRAFLNDPESFLRRL